MIYPKLFLFIHTPNCPAKATITAPEVAGFQAQSHVIKGRDTVTAMLGLAQQLGVHRIVVGTTPKSGLVRALTHSVTARLLERAPMPVEVVMTGNSPWYVRFGVPVGFGALIAALAID